MNYFFNRKSNGGSFDESTVNAVWQKGQIIFGQDPNIYRKDTCGALMKKSEYGNTNSQYGWEIDHIKPSSLGGSDALYNLQPLQWENNRSKSDNWPHWSCKVKAA